MKSKMETLIFTSDSGKDTKAEETVIVKRDYIPVVQSNAIPVVQSNAQGISKDVVDEESAVEVEVENVERPVDLYKAIFSDDEDDDEDTSVCNGMGNPEKKVEAANTTLNRLIAGDLLESLGKELGLEVPPELPSSTNKARTSSPPKGAGSGYSSILPVDNKPPSTHEIPRRPEISQEAPRDNTEPFNGNLTSNSARSNSKSAETGALGNQFDKIIF